MNFNIANGGLAMKVGSSLYLSDISGYTGTTIVDTVTGETNVTMGLFWFMNNIDHSIYYSDQQRGNALCKFDMNTQTIEIIQKKPCYGILHIGEWLYYINDDDRKLYRCKHNGRSEDRLTDEPVICFIANGNRIYYSTEKGVRWCNLSGSNVERISESVAIGMIMMGDTLAYADKNNNFTLTLLDVTTKSTSIFKDISPTSLNTDGRYLYCSNRQNDRSIYRIDTEQGTSIRICGDRADYLHIIEDEIYFCSRNEWFRMSLLGGQATRAATLPRLI
ncbi:hypothetical protein J2T13_001445 [Paenibacillus sp. DS2015]|uniref:DUF5050 domain-containing protein n=1 Tax=Paenibacillus sp. DS2015 TaxID=3373917 RepID=UPI003D22B8E5